MKIFRNVFLTALAGALCTALFTAPVLAGSVVGWGFDPYSQSVVPNTSVPSGNDFTAIAAGWYNSVALKADGSIVEWANSYPYGPTASHTPVSGNDFTAIAAGLDHGLALRSDGSIAAWAGWGGNWYGEADAPAGNDFTAIAASGGLNYNNSYSLALKADGSIIGWGSNHTGETSVPSGNDFVAIAAGESFGLALKADGSLAGWGNNDYGQTNVPSGNDFTAISAGSYHGLALRSDGSIVAWGADASWAIQHLNVPSGQFTAIAASDAYNLALKSDGSLVAWGSYNTADIPSGNHFVAIAAGGDGHALALAVPEPSALTLGGMALAGIATIGVRRRRKPA